MHSYGVYFNVVSPEPKHVMLILFGKETHKFLTLEPKPKNLFLQCDFETP